MSANEINNSRRAFLRGGFLTRDGRERHAQQQRPLGPAPPWHQGRLEPEYCQACEAPCVSSCQPGIIKRHPEEHQFSGLPYLDFTDTGCTFCGDCVSACPQELDKTAPAAKLGQVQLNRQACLSWNNTLCMSCRNLCDYGALSLDQQRQMHLDENACNACGRCLSVCPSQALSLQFTDNRYAMLSQK